MPISSRAFMGQDSIAESGQKDFKISRVGSGVVER